MSDVFNILSVPYFVVVEHKMLDNLDPPFAFTLWVLARFLLDHRSTMAHAISPILRQYVLRYTWAIREGYRAISLQPRQSSAWI